MKGKQICTNCGYIGDGVKKKAGSGAIEIALWFISVIMFFSAMSASNNAENLAIREAKRAANFFAGGNFSFSFSGDASARIFAYRQEANFLTIIGVLFLVIALAYTIWRFSARKPICPKCKTATMIPLDSPVGQKIYRELYNEDIKNIKKKLVE